MKPHNYLIAIGLFSTIVVVMLMVAANIHSTYEAMGVDIQDIDESQSDAFNKISDIDAQAFDAEEEIRGTDVGGEDASTTFLGGALKAFQIVIRGLTVPYDLFEEAGTLFNIPEELWAFAYVATIIVVIWTGIYMIFKFTGD